MTITAVEITNVSPNKSSSQIGHTFVLEARAEVSKRKAGRLSGEGIDCPDLEWKETIEWFEQDAQGNWRFDRKEEIDKYKQNPESNTFYGWRARFLASVNDNNHPPEGLKNAVRSADREKDNAAKHWIAEHGFSWTFGIVDTPALGVRPGARRRVVYFDLGFKGCPFRATATQILETVNGRPSILHFVRPAISKAAADAANNLAALRI